MTYKRKEVIGDCTLYLGDCMEVMPTLGKVGAVVDNSNAVVFNNCHEESASRKHSEKSESGSSLGSQTRGYYGSVCERNTIAAGNGGTIPSFADSLSESYCTDGDSFEIEGQGGKGQRALQGRNTKHGLQKNGGEKTLQPMRGNESASDSSYRPQSHEQCARESGSSLQPLPHQSSQTGVVELPKGWAILTDPPYGIGIDGQKECIKGKRRIRKAHDFKQWDSERPEVAIRTLSSIKCPQIIWGGNYFCDLLPATKGWLVWDKAQYGLTMSDGELAWTNIKAPMRIFNLHRAYLWQEKPEHPTQKPIALMQWCIDQLPADTQTILDPFMGSGTTLVACAKMGRKGIGIELDPDYFDIACKRVEDAYRQGDLFINSKPEPEPYPMEQGEFLTTKPADNN